MDSSTSGVLQELKVALDLTQRGYEIFRPISPSASCDLIAMRDNKKYRIEVKTKLFISKKHYEKPPKYIKQFAERADILAIPNDNGIVYYYLANGNLQSTLEPFNKILSDK